MSDDSPTPDPPAPPITIMRDTIDEWLRSTDLPHAAPAASPGPMPRQTAPLPPLPPGDGASAD